MSDLVSVIIPAYNVDKYIEKCVDSVLNQSYENIELIVVNDGSSDNTLNIVQHLQNKDDRLKVFDKENEGVSCARNDGLKIARGKYVVFVDGDDYLSKDCIEYMVALAKNTGCKFCLSTDCYSSINDEQNKIITEKTILSDECIALLLSPRVIVGCWNKIYERQFLEDNQMSFSDKLFYGEGLNFIIKCAEKAETIGVGNRKVYYYRRNNSESATSKFNIEKYRNGERALDIIKGDISIDSREIEKMFVLHKSLFSLGAMVSIIQNKCKKQYRLDYLRYRKYLKKHLMFIWRSKKISLYRKSLLLGGLMFPGLIARMDDKRRKKIGKNSI